MLRFTKELQNYYGIAKNY